MREPLDKNVTQYHFNLNIHQKVPLQHEEGTFFAFTFLLGLPHVYISRAETRELLSHPTILDKGLLILTK